MICIIVILGENLLNAWCRMRMRPARLVSYAFLYTTHMLVPEQQEVLINSLNVSLLPKKVFMEFSPQKSKQLCFECRRTNSLKKKAKDFLDLNTIDKITLCKQYTSSSI